MDTEKELELRIDKNDEPPVANGAEFVASQIHGDWLKITYKLKKKNLTIKGKFTKLDCSSCLLTVLNVSRKKELKELICSENNTLSKLYISDNVELTDLECSDCDLSALNLSKNPKLTNIYCQGNKISGKNTLMMPDVKKIGGGKIYFKTGANKNQKLPKANVEQIKALGWNIFYHSGSKWEEYKGED